MKLSPFWSGAAGAALILLLMAVLEQHYQRQRAAQQQLEVMQVLQLARASIKEQLERYRYLGAALTARTTAAAAPPLAPDEFAGVIRRLVGEDDLLRGVRIAHDDIPVHSYIAPAPPGAGEVIRVRLPFPPAASHGTPPHDEGIELDIDQAKLLTRAGLTGLRADLQVALRAADGRLIAGSPRLFTAAQAALEIDLPFGQWRLAGGLRPSPRALPWPPLLAVTYALMGGLYIWWLRAGQLNAQRLALYDPLTGLPNRRLLQDRLERANAASARSGRHVVMLYLDLDNFKPVNDCCGHHAGDAVLREVARRLRESVRRSDTVARLSGDEFVLLLEELTSAGEAETVADKVLRSFARPIPAGGRTFVLGCSIGLAEVEHDCRLDEMVERADQAMYQAKHNGKNGYRWYVSEPPRLHALGGETSTA